MRKVCSILLAGGLIAALPWALTQAVFSDSASIGSNSFTTGTVDISTSPASAVVTYSAMAPGDSTTQSVTVTNGGTLSQRYAIAASATNSDSKGLKDALTLTIKTVDVTTPSSPCDNFDGTQLYSGDIDSTAGKLVGDSTQGAHTGDRTLAAGVSEALCLRVLLPTTTGNSSQNASTTATFTFDAEQTANNA